MSVGFRIIQCVFRCISALFSYRPTYFTFWWFHISTFYLFLCNWPFFFIIFPLLFLSNSPTTNLVAGTTDDLPTACCPVHLLVRSQSSTLKVSLARILFSARRSLFLSPGISVFKTFLSMCSSSLLVACPYQFDMLSVIVLEAYTTIGVLRKCSFPILHLPATPCIHLNSSILISFTLIPFSCRFGVANVSVSHAHNTFLQIFPFLQPGPICTVISVSTQHPYSVGPTHPWAFEMSNLSSSSPNYLHGFAVSLFTMFESEIKKLSFQFA